MTPDSLSAGQLHRNPAPPASLLTRWRDRGERFVRTVGSSAAPLRRNVRFAIFSFVLLCLPLVLGAGLVHHLRYALVGAMAMLGIGLVVSDVQMLALVAIPGSLIVERISGGSSNLSTADLLLFFATISALAIFRLKEAPIVGRLLTLVAIYQASTFITLVYNPYKSNVIEWVHEAFLAGGSLIVGWVVGRAGKASPALASYMVLASALAIWGTLWTLSHHLKPSTLPFGYQKNFIGDMLSFAVIIAYVRPDWLGWKPRWARLAIGICLVGMLASQSKQAIIATAVGVMVLTFRMGKLGRRANGMLLAMVPLIIVAYVILHGEFTSSNRFNSVYTRQSQYSTTFHVWHASEWFGVGLRWWYTSRFPGGSAPPNAELELLSSAGIVGMLALLLLMIVALVILWRVAPRWGTLAFVILLMRFIQGQFDIFWLTGQGAIEWMIVGLCLGAMALHEWRERSALSPQPPLLVTR